MLVYNSQTHRKQELEPIEPGKIRMYVCGPTVYDQIHIGNGRTFLSFDVIRRYLMYKGYEVTFAQNLTDVDDKIINRANEQGRTAAEVAEEFSDKFIEQMHRFGILDPDIRPRATREIEAMQKMIQLLIDEGCAYPVPSGDVYFSVRSDPGYGKLKGQDIDDMENGARISPTEQKRDPLDFALWKGEKPGEPSWPSPWGKGRPGWHIECSAMSMKYLGETFDIHGGGMDLIFPHHENEIAQSECACGKPFVHYWMHNGYININNQKMSKSLGNFFTVRDIAKEYDLEAVRMFLLTANYRNPVNFSRELMDQTVTSLQRLYTARDRLFDTAIDETADDSSVAEAIDGFRDRFNEAMDDDLNTADALGVLFDFARWINIFATTAHTKASIDAVKARYAELNGVLGLVVKEKKEDFPEEALALLEARKEAKKAKDWAKADAIRDELKAMGFAVEDTREGAKLKRI